MGQNHGALKISKGGKDIPNAHARATYCDFDLSLTEIYKDLISLGFRDVFVAPDILNAKANENFDALLSQSELLRNYVLEYVKSHNDFPFGPFTSCIRRLFLPRLDVDIDYGCGLGKTTFAVDFRGDIYPCHRHSSNEDQKMGNVFGEFRENNQVYTSEKCKTCWSRYSCTHGCSYNDHELTGSTSMKNDYWCRYSQKLTELSLALCSQLSEKQLMNIMAIKPVLIDNNN
ncbi:MAG: SPASM domain-containing protein [Chloroflexi bacterium]|nr:SPASM domain-containing protein [Chloroflexota bacterium]